MKKQEFKNLIKESVKEVLLEGGILSTIIAEVVKGLGVPVVAEQKTKSKITESNFVQQEQESQSQRLMETKKKMLDAIGKSSYGGIDVFEGTQPARGSSSNSQHSSLGDIDPSDPGVDISALIRKTPTWKHLIKDKG